MLRAHKVVRIDRLPDDVCPKCCSKKVLGPRIVRDKEKWCNCYGCGHEWEVDKKRTQQKKFGPHKANAQ